MPRWCAIAAFALSSLAVGTVAGARPAGLQDYPPVTSSSSDVVPLVVVVVRGDHLWSISEGALGDRLGRAVAPDEVGPFWRVVIDMNRATLRSGDPDLIYPGEEIALPDV